MKKQCKKCDLNKLHNLTKVEIKQKQ